MILHGRRNGLGLVPILVHAFKASPLPPPALAEHQKLPPRMLLARDKVALAS